jgi:hypothetical protein
MPINHTTMRRVCHRDSWPTRAGYPAITLFADLSRGASFQKYKIYRDPAGLVGFNCNSSESLTPIADVMCINDHVCLTSNLNNTSNPKMASRYPTRQLGKDGPQVTALGWGAMGLSIAYGNVLPDNERLALLDQIYDIGERNWDSGNF